MIFIDSNIPMYLIGAPHAHKVDAQRLLEKFVADRQRLVTDAEVFEEILHRNAAINSRDAIQPASDALLRVVDQVLPIDIAIVEHVKQIVLAYRQLSARDGLRVAIMQRHSIDQIFSFDSGFDGIPGITRVA